MSDRIAISVKNVSKDFRLPHLRANSVKELFVSPFQALQGSKKTEVQHALKDISFDIKEGEFFGIVGRNGSGKSTLLKILAEIYQPTSGEVSVLGRLVPFIELGVGFNPELTGRENVYLSGALNGFSTKEIDAMYDDIVAFAELEQFMDQKLKNYSSGMQVRLAFSVATRSKADVLLIDEVLAVGDADFQRKCFNYFKQLKKDKKTVVFVSHDMEAIREYCDRAVLIEKSSVVSIGNPVGISKKYNQMFALENSKEKKNIIYDEIGSRYGTREASIEKVHIQANSETVQVSEILMVKSDIKEVNLGIHVIDSKGKEVFATNTEMVGGRIIVNPKAGEEYRVGWKFDNILVSGNYTVSLTAVDENGVALDWRENVKEFKVKRDIFSTTSILPDVTCEINVILK